MKTEILSILRKSIGKHRKCLLHHRVCGILIIIKEIHMHIFYPFKMQVFYCISEYLGLFLPKNMYMFEHIKCKNIKTPQLILLQRIQTVNNKKIQSLNTPYIILQKSNHIFCIIQYYNQLYREHIWMAYKMDIPIITRKKIPKM